jgi:hypothetical protein
VGWEAIGNQFPTPRVGRGARLRGGARVRRLSCASGPQPEHGSAVLALRRLEYFGGIGVYVEPDKLVAAHCPDMGEGGRKMIVRSP